MSSSCQCRLCRPGPAPEPEPELDDQDRKLLADVERHGWHVIAIGAESGLPSWAFTVGLTHTFGVPELAAFGLSREVGYTTLNMLGDLVREGERLRPGSRIGDVLEGFDLELRAGDSAWNYALFGYARWFYPHHEPAFMQCVWPDMSGRFPWEQGFEERLKRFQPALWMAPAEAPVGPWRAWWYETMWRPRPHASGLVIVSKRAAAGEAPILGVQASTDGHWTFLDGGRAEREDFTFAHLHHVLENDPSLEAMIDLEPGSIAWREHPGGPWSVSPLED
jgi:hypothetical protein